MKHPFPVQAHFDQSIVFTFALPKDQLPVLPDHLVPDLYDDKFGFIAMAIVDTRQLRPKGFPAFLGRDFKLIGYRVFVRYTTTAGKRLRGLYILKSETNRKQMEFLGNIFTSYNYTTTDIQFSKADQTEHIFSKKSDFSIHLDWSEITPDLPEGSPFPDWKTARRYAGPLPFTFSYDAQKKTMMIIEGVRQNWKPTPIVVKDYRVGFFEDFKLAEPVLASAFVVRDIPYWWRKGRVEVW